MVYYIKYKSVKLSLGTISAATRTLPAPARAAPTPPGPAPSPCPTGRYSTPAGTQFNLHSLGYGFCLKKRRAFHCDSLTCLNHLNLKYFWSRQSKAKAQVIFTCGDSLRHRSSSRLSAFFFFFSWTLFSHCNRES